MAARGRRCVVIGIGNAGRGDDAAGRAVVRRLRGTMQAEIELVELDGETAALLASLDGADAAYLIDACVSGAPAGSVRRFAAAATPLLDDDFAMSTHGLGLAEAIGLADALGQLPPCCVVYAIEAASFDTGAPLSPPVADAVGEVARRIRNEIGVIGAPGGPIGA